MPVATTRIEAIRKIREDSQAGLVDGYWLDATTADMLAMVYDALRPELREKFERIPLPRLVDFGWKHVR